MIFDAVTLIGALVLLWLIGRFNPLLGALAAVSEILIVMFIVRPVKNALDDPGHDRDGVQ